MEEGISGVSRCVDSKQEGAREVSGAAERAMWLEYSESSQGSRGGGER